MKRLYQNYRIKFSKNCPNGLTLTPTLTHWRGGTSEKKYAFTLAETLITLVIIGVVAALTVPNLLQQHKKQEYTARLKKFYSTISQVIIKSASENNNWSTWADEAAGINDYSGVIVKDFLDKYMLPYLSYNKFYKQDQFYYIMFNDGSYFHIWKGACIHMIYDVNGSRKPNKDGVDIHHFLYCPKSASSGFSTYRLIPYLENIYNTREKAKEKCSNYNNHCTGLLLMDNWEFKDDYPLKI